MMHQSKFVNHNPSVSDFLQPSTGASSQPQQTPALSSLISLQSLSETRNGSYTIMGNKRKLTQMSPLRSTTPVKPLSMVPATSTHLYKSPQQFTDSNLTQHSFVSPTANQFLGEEKPGRKIGAYMSKSALRGSTNAYSPRPSMSDLSPLGTSQSFIKKSNEASICIKAENPKTPTKAQKLGKPQDSSNRLYILSSKLEGLIQKLQKHKDECLNLVKPQTDRMSNILSRKSPGRNVKMMVSSRGNTSSCEDLDDNFARTLQNCEVDWKLFKEDVKKACTMQKDRRDVIDSDHMRDDSLDLANVLKKLNTSDENSEGDIKNFAGEMRRFKEDLKTEKAKIMGAVAKQAKEKEQVEENMETFLKKVMKFRDGFNTKVDHISKSIKTCTSLSIQGKELEILLNGGEASKGKHPTTKPERSQSRSRENVPSKTIDLEQAAGASCSKENLKGQTMKKKEEIVKKERDDHILTIQNRQLSQDKKGDVALKRELDNMKKELQKTKDENLKMGKVLEALQFERMDVKEQLQRAKDAFKKENEPLQDGFGATTPVSKGRLGSKGAVSYRKTLETTDSIKKEKGKAFRQFSARKEDSISRLGKELKRELLSINRQVSECQTARGETYGRNNLLDRDGTRSPGSARGNIQTLLEKLNLLSDDYEAYKGQKEQNLKDIQESKGEEYGRLVNILHEKDTSILSLKEENAKLRHEAGKMAKQLGLYCWSPREIVNMQKEKSKKSENIGSLKTLTDGSLNYSLSEKPRNEFEGLKRIKEADGPNKKTKLSQGRDNRVKSEDELETMWNNFGITRRDMKSVEQTKKECEELKRENTWQTSKENLGIKRGLIEKIAMMGREGVYRANKLSEGGTLKKDQGKSRTKGESFLKI